MIRPLQYITFCLLLSITSSFGQTNKLPIHLSKIVESKIVKSNSLNRVRASEPLLIRVGEGVKKSTVKELGVEIIRPLGQRYYIALVSQDLYTPNGEVSDLWSINDLWKLQSSLMISPGMRNTPYIIKTSSIRKTVSKLRALKTVNISKVKNDQIYVNTDLRVLTDHIIHFEEVQYIGQESLVPQTEARVIDMNLNPNKINKIHHTWPMLNGQGMRVSIQEPSYDKEDIDLIGRDIESDLTSEFVDRHSTEMATIVAGSGNSYITGRGVAWNASITSSDFSDIVPDSDQSYRDLNVWVQNHSYGTVPESFYGVFAEAYDLSANNNPDLLHVFSSGNRGVTAPADGPYAGIEGYSNITGNFKMAKNLLVVGSVDTVGNHLEFASGGPAYDGRVKPEIVAYASVGTSNSAAIVSGLSLLMQQAYAENNSGDIPPSALVKSILINSARDVGAPQVDFLTGYGNVDGYRSIQNINAGRYFTNTITNGEEQRFVLTVPDNAKNLKITLVWNDPAAQVNAEKALVNDLDLQLKFGDNQTMLPWVLNSEPDISQLELPATRKADHLNNIEQVTLSEFVGGDFNITVNGFDIPQGPQEYYIAYQWDEIDQFEWDYPTGSDNMPFNGESGSYFRWESSLETTIGMLEYSIDGGNSWITVDEAVDLSRGQLRWDAPMDINSKAQARMTVGAEVYLTDEFTISRPQRIEVGFICGDSLLLQWNSIQGASEYTLYTYDSLSGTLQNVATLSDTAIVLNTSEIPSQLVSLQATLTDGKKLIRNEFANFTFQGVDCYISSFFSESVIEEGIYLNLDIGTVYQVDEIIFERKEGDQFISLGSIFPQEGDSSSFRFLDANPAQGLNINRARIVLANGQEVVTGESQIFFLTDLPFLVFPNPVLRGDGVNVFSKDFGPDAELTFVLYDRLGKEVVRRPIFSDRENIDLIEVKRGMYIYHIIGPDIVFKGRIMLE